MEAGGPFVLEIHGRKRLVIRDILVGDVWFAGGQSNMEFPLHKSVDGEQAARRGQISRECVFSLVSRPRTQAEGGC